MSVEPVAESLRRLVDHPIAAAADGGDDPLVVSADAAVLRETLRSVASLADAAADDGDDDAPGCVRLCGPPAALDAATDEFRTAARAADLVESDRLDLRTVDDRTLPSVLVAAGRALAPVPLPDGRAVALSTDESAVVSAVRTAFAETVAAGDRYRLGVPAYSRLLEELGSEVGSTTREEFAAALDAPVTVRGPDDTLDEIDAALLLGARNRAQLYELSEWAESVGLASRATVSSRKRRLEAVGLLATEKVATDVGRPRQRLVLADESLASVGVSDLVRAARSVLVDPGAR
ncbi:transcriptional regulator TbsP domain-containing protein [Candidatus Halobonum tyrrellensis]|uniref:Uncharacterized protein n=1 Tax=Candidatus Halobonum tyrrellensis G22 TaxID=1324957 RepID=V4H8C8_9EURY|nr:DUF5821 family protein [Candidatus Halobonum tyrrellensis]ESP86940.1 hypothetical protein K933_16807 [Candidatus Halobonum tyrrellensis G22]